jgi:hypothetical protein
MQWFASRHAHDPRVRHPRRTPAAAPFSAGLKTCSAERSQSTGRDVLVLRASDDRWLLAWRGQFRA